MPVNVKNLICPIFLEVLRDGNSLFLMSKCFQKCVCIKLTKVMLVCYHHGLGDETLLGVSLLWRGNYSYDSRNNLFFRSRETNGSTVGVGEGGRHQGAHRHIRLPLRPFQGTQGTQTSHTSPKN